MNNDDAGRYFSFLTVVETNCSQMVNEVAFGKQVGSKLELLNGQFFWNMLMSIIGIASWENEHGWKNTIASVSKIWLAYECLENRRTVWTERRKYKVSSSIYFYLGSQLKIYFNCVANLSMFYSIHGWENEYSYNKPVVFNCFKNAKEILRKFLLSQKIIISRD